MPRGEGMLGPTADLEAGAQKEHRSHGQVMWDPRALHDPSPAPHLIRHQARPPSGTWSTPSAGQGPGKHNTHGCAWSRANIPRGQHCPEVRVWSLGPKPSSAACAPCDLERVTELTSQGVGRMKCAHTWIQGLEQGLAQGRAK